MLRFLPYILLCGLHEILLGLVKLSYIFIFINQLLIFQILCYPSQLILWLPSRWKVHTAHNIARVGVKSMTTWCVACCLLPLLIRINLISRIHELVILGIGILVLSSAYFKMLIFAKTINFLPWLIIDRLKLHLLTIYPLRIWVGQFHPIAPALMNTSVLHRYMLNLLR